MPEPGHRHPIRPITERPTSFESEQSILPYHDTRPHKLSSEHAKVRSSIKDGRSYPHRRGSVSSDPNSRARLFALNGQLIDFLLHPSSSTETK